MSLHSPHGPSQKWLPLGSCPSPHHSLVHHTCHFTHLQFCDSVAWRSLTSIISPLSLSLPCQLSFECHSLLIASTICLTGKLRMQGWVSKRGDQQVRDVSPGTWPAGLAPGSRAAPVSWASCTIPYYGDIKMHEGI